MLLFPDCDGDRCSQSLAGNARMVVWCPLCSVMRKEERESVRSTAAWTGVETKSNGEYTWSVVHEGT